MKKRKVKMLIIELNEFCPEFLKDTSKKLNLKNLEKIFNFKHTLTYTNEKKEFHGLDPWVQWVGIHNGVPLSKHGVKRLGIKSNKSSNQIWNTLSKRKNISWVVTGVMNSNLGNKEGCISFFPDPWSSHENAYPKELNNLLELSRYVAKNYLSLNYYQLLKKSLKTLKFFLRRENLNLSRIMFLKVFQSFFSPGINIHTLTTLLDYLLVLYFCRERSKRNPDFSIIFLNHIAHLQHHFWLESPYVHPQMEHGLKICDEIFEKLLKSITDDKEKILIINALKQKRSGLDGIQVYRQIDPKNVLNKLNIRDVIIEQNMTNDGNLIFKTKAKADKAYQIISKCHLNTGEKLFYVERISKFRIFMQLDLNHIIKEETVIISDGNVIPFYELFSNLSRTGSHIPEGDIFSKNIKIPEKIENHEIYKYIYDSF